MPLDSTYASVATPETRARHAAFLERQPYPLLFVTLSGSHLYGFSSADSDWDLRGAHVTPAATVVGLDSYRETVEDETLFEDRVLDELVTHDIRKYFQLLLRNNGYVLEQIFSPIVIFPGERLDQLRSIAKRCITSHHSLHYKGFGYGEWTKFVKNPTKTVKRILYVLRVLMTGIHLMRTGEVESNIVRLNEELHLPYIDELIAQKRSGEENSTLAAGRGLDYYTREYERLMDILIAAAQTSHLPKMPDPAARAELNGLLLELRLGAQ